MTREEFNKSLEVSVAKACSELSNEVNTLECNNIDRFSETIVLMYTNAIKQSVKIVMDTLEKNDVIKFD